MLNMNQLGGAQEGRQRIHRGQSHSKRFIAHLLLVLISNITLRRLHRTPEQKVERKQDHQSIHFRVSSLSQPLRLHSNHLVDDTQPSLKSNNELNNNPLMLPTQIGIQPPRTQILRPSLQRYTTHSPYARTRYSAGRLLPSQRYLRKNIHQWSSNPTAGIQAQKKFSQEEQNKSISCPRRSITPQNRRFKYSENLVEMSKEDTGRKARNKDYNYNVDRSQLGQMLQTAKDADAKMPPSSDISEANLGRGNRSFVLKADSTLYSSSFDQRYPRTLRNRDRRCKEYEVDILRNRAQAEVKQVLNQDGSADDGESFYRRRRDGSKQNTYEKPGELYKPVRKYNLGEKQPQNSIFEKSIYANMYRSVQIPQMYERGNQPRSSGNRQQRLDRSENNKHGITPSHEMRIDINDRLNRLELPLNKTIDRLSKPYRTGSYTIKTSANCTNAQQELTHPNRGLIDFKAYQYIGPQPFNSQTTSGSRSLKDAKTTDNSNECFYEDTPYQKLAAYQIKRRGKHQSLQLQNPNTVSTDNAVQKENRSLNYHGTRVTFSRQLSEYEDEALKKIRTINELNSKIGERIKNILNNIS